MTSRELPAVLAAAGLVAVVAAVVLLWASFDERTSPALATSPAGAARPADTGRVDRPGNKPIASRPFTPQDGFSGDPAAEQVDPQVVGRLLDEQGRPMPHLDFRYLWSPWQRDWWYGTTDAGGRFSATITWTWEPGDARVLQLRSGSDPSTESVDRAQVPLARALDSPIADIGDVVMVAPPLLAAGMVTTSRGEPVRDAQVRVSVQEHALDPADPPTWTLLEWLLAETREDGSFELRGELEGTWLRIWATRADHATMDWVDTAPGNAGVALHLDASAGIAGSVLLDPGVSLTRVSVAFENHQRLQRFGSLGASPADGLYADRSFRMFGLAPGRGDLVVRAAGIAEPLAVVRDLELEPGATCRDARLDGIDARRGLRAVVISASRADGGPFSGARIRRLGPDGSFVDEARTQAHGSAYVLVPPSGSTFAVDSWGTVPVRIEDLLDDVRVSLQPAPLLEFVVTEGDLPESPYHVRVVLVPVEDPERLLPVMEEILLARAGDRIPIAPGRYRVATSLERGWGTPGSPLGDGEGRIVTIGETSNQRLEVALPPVLMARARARLEDR
jgi:hypothetical protein